MKTKLPKLNFIGLHGKMQSGKDTLATHLQRGAEGYRCLPVSFALPLKKACQTLFGGGHNNYFGTNAEKDEATTFWEERLGENFRSYRSILQWVGTDLFRAHMHPDFWLYALEKYLMDELDAGRIVAPRDIIVCSDVRYDNEAHFIKRLGGLVAHIKRADGKVAETTGIAGHRSEAGLLPSSVDLEYTCTLEEHPRIALELVQKVKAL
jgi:hypothetical protein